MPTKVMPILYYRFNKMSSYLYFIQYNTDVLVGREVIVIFPNLDELILIFVNLRCISVLLFT